MINPEGTESNNTDLSTFDFEKLGKKQAELLHELSTFTFQHSFLKLLKKQYGDTNLKEKFIDINKVYIDGEDMAQLNQESLNYKKQLKQGSTMITATCTLAALIYGICVLPARKSPVRYTAGGFALGVAISYGFWRLQLNKYDKKVNQIFKKIVRDQYNEQKGSYK